MKSCVVLCILCLLFFSLATGKKEEYTVKEEDVVDEETKNWSPEEITALLIEHKILPEPARRRSKHAYSLGKFSIEFKNVDALWTQSPFRQLSQIYNSCIESIQNWRNGTDKL